MRGMHTGQTFYSYAKEVGLKIGVRKNVGWVKVVWEFSRQLMAAVVWTNAKP